MFMSKSRVTCCASIAILEFDWPPFRAEQRDNVYVILEYRQVKFKRSGCFKSLDKKPFVKVKIDGNQSALSLQKPY